MQRKSSGEDPFLPIAISFILGVVMGFTLVLLGVILFFLALLSSTVDTNTIPVWVWFLAGVGSEIIGIWLMRRSLKGSPPPGTFGPGSDK